MYKIEPMLPSDIFSLDIVNLDRKSESFQLNYYFYYLVNHGEDCVVVSSPFTCETSFVYNRNAYGYMIGKLEEKEGVVSAHISAITVAPGHRRNSFGRLCMNVMEMNGNLYGAYFVDLYVRKDNIPAIRFYKKLGYTVYRKVLGYYVDSGEDALDMRKSLALDEDKRYMVRGVDIPACMLDR